MRRFLKGTGGFTLVELLITIAIIGVVAGVVLPNVGKFTGSGKTQASSAELQNVQKAMDIYMADNAVTFVASATAVSDFAASVPVLFPNYLRQQTTSPCNYDWTSGGLVSQICP